MLDVVTTKSWSILAVNAESKRQTDVDGAIRWAIYMRSVLSGGVQMAVAAQEDRRSKVGEY